MSAAPERPGSAEKVIELPATVLRAESASEFRTMLDQVRKAAGLTSGQIAVKAAIARSTAYALSDGTKDSVPAKPEQVRAYVTACNLSPVQVEVVMDVLQELVDKPKQNVQHNGSGSASRTSVAAFDTARADDTVSAGVPHVGEDISEADFRMREDTAKARLTRFRSSQTSRRHPESSWVALMQYVLMNPDRSEGALKLLCAFIVLVAMILVFVGYVLTFTSPEIAYRFGIGIGVGIGVGIAIVPAIAFLRRHRKP